MGVFSLKWMIYLGVLFIVGGLHIKGYIDMRLEQEIIKRGQPIRGKVVKINYVPTDSSFSREYQCTCMVSFTWEGNDYRVRALATFAPKQYVVGSDITLLYLPEYRKKAVIYGGMPSSAKSMATDSVILFILAAVVFFVLIQP